MLDVIAFFGVAFYLSKAKKVGKRGVRKGEYKNHFCTATKCWKPLHPKNEKFCAEHREMALAGRDFTTKDEGGHPTAGL